MGWKIEGMEKRGAVDLEGVDLCCFLMLRPKRVKVGRVDGGGEARDAADRLVDDVVDLCCWLAV